MNRFSLVKILLASTCIGFWIPAQAQNDILSTAPSAPQSGVQRPHGYERCDIIPGGFRRGTWETMHLRCHYKHHRVYETGYFRCARFEYNNCRRWKWISERWVR